MKGQNNKFSNLENVLYYVGKNSVNHGYIIIHKNIQQSPLVKNLFILLSSISRKFSK